MIHPFCSSGGAAATSGGMGIIRWSFEKGGSLLQEAGTCRFGGQFFHEPGDTVLNGNQKTRRNPFPMIGLVFKMIRNNIVNVFDEDNVTLKII